MASSVTRALTLFNESIATLLLESEQKTVGAAAERDEAIKTLHERELELERWRQKATQQETTIAQQADMIAVLKRESANLHDQSTNWKDNFIRVEQQRCALQSRLDDADRRPHQPTLPMTPVSRYEEPAPRIEQLKTPAKSKPPIVPLKQSITPNYLAESSTTTSQRKPIQTKVIRRVQATYEIKAESDEEDQLSPEQAPTTSHTHRHSRVVQSDSAEDDESDEDEDELMIGPDNDSVEPQPAVRPKKHMPVHPTPAPTKKRKMATGRPNTNPGPVKRR